MGGSVWSLFSLHCGDFSLAVSHEDKASQGTMTGTHQLFEGLVHYHLDTEVPQGLPAQVPITPYTLVHLGFRIKT